MSTQVGLCHWRGTKKKKKGKKTSKAKRRWCFRTFICFLKPKEGYCITKKSYAATLFRIYCQLSTSLGGFSHLWVCAEVCLMWKLSGPLLLHLTLYSVVSAALSVLHHIHPVGSHIVSTTHFWITTFFLCPWLSELAALHAALTTQPKTSTEVVWFEDSSLSRNRENYIWSFN